MIYSQAKKSFDCVGNYIETCKYNESLSYRIGSDLITRLVHSGTNPVARRIFDAIHKVAKKDFNDRCVDPAGRRAFLEHVVCAKNTINRDKINSCVHGFTGQLNHQINQHASMTKEERIQTSCCGIAQLHECLITNVQSACPKNLAYWRRKIIMTEHMEKTCGEFQTVDYCDENASARFWPKLKRVFISPEGEGVDFKYQSPATALIVYMSQRD